MKFTSFDNVLMASALLTFAVFLGWSVKIIAAGWRLGVACWRDECSTRQHRGAHNHWWRRMSRRNWILIPNWSS